jgi:hypothetical protein
MSGTSIIAFANTDGLTACGDGLKKIKIDSAGSSVI